MRRAWMIVLLGLGMGFAGCEEETDPTGAGGGKTGQPCEREADCDDNNPCTYDFCPAGACTHDIIDGQENPEAEQVDGDCMMKGCSDGTPADLPDNDPPEDPVGNDCIEKACMDGMAVDQPSPSNAGCDLNGMNAACDGMGVCSCAPAPNDNGVLVYWVDPIEGNDAPGQGARRGPCAFKSVTYALTQVQDGDIRLTANMDFSVYSAASGETVPWVLTQNQRLRCFDNSSGQDMRAVLQGNGTHGGTTATVVMQGTNNQVDDCQVQAQGAAHGILITSSAVAGHQVSDANISGADAGITVLDTADDVTVNNNQIHDNATAGLQWLGVGQQGQIDDNVFSNNGVDILCADVSPDIDGQNNGGPTCNVCQNCPF